MAQPKDLFLPAAMVTSGAGIPDVCSRHGDPAVRGRRVQFISRPPGWSYILLLAGALPFLLVSMVLRKTLFAPRWPYCYACNHRIRFSRLGALALLLAASGTIAAAVTLGREHPVIDLWGVILFVLLFVASLVVLISSDPTRVARGIVTRDGYALRLREVAPGFVSALPSPPPLAGPPMPPESWAPQPPGAAPGW
ncbi:MAG: hypothetical protein M3O55_04135 [Actinomycetota bacterium]|nr:hypothetical protein [Actinomycetota bacterium]